MRVQVKDNLIRNAGRAGINPLLDEAVKKSENVVDDFKNSMQIRIAENDKNLTIEKKPMEKIRPSVNVKPKDTKSTACNKIDDVTYSKVAAGSSSNTGNSSEAKTDITSTDNTTRALEANAVVNTDNLMKNMLVAPSMPEIPLTNVDEMSIVANEALKVPVAEGLAVENAVNTAATDEEVYSDKIIVDADSVKNTTIDRSAVQNAELKAVEIKTTEDKEGIALSQGIKHNEFKDIKADEKTDFNYANMVNPEIKADEEATIQYNFGEKNDDEKPKAEEEKIEFDISDKVINSANHKNAAALRDVVNADLDLGIVENSSVDNELRAQIIEQISNYIDAASIAKKDTLELMLNPASLGKIMMQVKQTASGVAISILCEAQKTYHLLRNQSGDIAGILAKKLEEPVVVNIQQESRQDYLNQNNKDSSKDAFYEQQSRNQEEKQNRQIADEATSFLSRLRLGLN